jgi:hypothetical protein
MVKSNVVQENGTFKKQATPKQRRSTCVQHSKLGKFQITVPMWIEQFPSFISSQLLACELAISINVLFLSVDKVLHLR